MTFTFSFHDDDISEDEEPSISNQPSPNPPNLSSLQITNAVPFTSGTAAETGTLHRPKTSTAFPTGQNLLPATLHTLDSLLSTLPERISYSTLSIPLAPSPSSTLPSSSITSVPTLQTDDSFPATYSSPTIKLPRRELWDVRVQIMAEDEDLHSSTPTNDSAAQKPTEEGLGAEDVKTGIYEGGFKSWECSVDLVRELSKRRHERLQEVGKGDGTGKGSRKVILEMGCGTALPSLALFQWVLKDCHDVKGEDGNLTSQSGTESISQHASQSVTIYLADYNPSVLRLVTVPNLLLSWAMVTTSTKSLTPNNLNSPWEDDGELEITPELIQQFKSDLVASNVDLRFISGAWGHDFETIFLTDSDRTRSDDELLVVAAETIYSPVALSAFGETLMCNLTAWSRRGANASALVGAKKVYFGVGGSMEDFVALIEEKKGRVERVREEEGGVRREIVEVWAT